MAYTKVGAWSKQGVAMPFQNSRVDVPLQKVSTGYFPNGFICDLIGTPIPVSKRSGILSGYGQDHLVLTNNKVYDRGEYKIVNGVSRDLTNTYYMHKHGLSDFVTEEAYNEVSDPFEAEADVIIALKSLLVIEKENNVASLLRGTSTYDSSHSVTLSTNERYDVGATSDPKNDFATATSRIQRDSGVIANAAIVPYPVARHLKYHPQFANALGNGKFEPLSDEGLKNALGVQYLYIPHAKRKSETSTDLVDFWGNDIIFFNKASQQEKRQRTFLYKIFHKSQNERVYKRKAENLPNSNRLFLDMFYQYRLNSNTAGYIIRNAIS